MVKYETKFAIGDKVMFAIKQGIDNGIVTGISIRENGITYCVVWSNKSESWHYQFEIVKA